MPKNDNAPCSHRYTAGYSFRIPQPFFRSLPCDSCGRRIKLSPPWQLLYWIVNIIGFIAAFAIAMSVQVNLLGSTLYVSLLVFLVLFGLVQLADRLILRFGKWAEAN